MKNTKSIHLEQKLQKMIESGDYPHNSVLPSETALAAQFHVARNTIRKAMATLREKGLLSKSHARLNKVNCPLATRRPPSRNIAWLWYLSPADMMGNAIYFEMFKILVELARDRDLGVQQFDLGPRSNWTPDMMEGKQWAGFFSVGLIPRTVGQKMHELIRGLPRLVSVDDVDDTPPPYLVSIDNYASAKLGMEHLLTCGYRRILIVITESEESHPFLERIRACRDAASLCDGASVEIAKVKGNYTISYIETLLRKWRHYDAIFSLTDLMALHIISAAQNIGIRIPEDVALMGFDGIYASQCVTPRLTTVAQPLREVMATALDMALKVKRAKTPPAPMRITYPGQLLPGGTTAASAR